MNLEAIPELVDALSPDFAHVAVGVAKSDAPPVVAIASQPGLPEMQPGSPCRVASISKIATGQLAAQVFGGQFNTDVSQVLGYDLRPDGMTVRLGHLLSHTSGLSDDGGYSLRPDRTLQAHLSESAVWKSAPGDTFEYCNLGYILVAAAIEVHLGMPFDQVAKERLKLSFNWSGRTADNAVPVFRRISDAFEPQIDENLTGEGPFDAGGLPINREIVRNPAAWSPQGGLRASPLELLQIASDIPSMDQSILYDPGPAQSVDLFDQYGAGLMILRRPSFYPRPLIGHFANAYGLAGGVWHDANAKMSFIYLLNGLAAGDDEDALRPAELRIFAAIAGLV